MPVDERTADLYLAKAAESLASAESDFAAGRYNSCANRAYYACFQAAVAALVRAGIGPSPRDRQWRHAAVQAQFVEQLINRRKHYSPAFRDTFERLVRLRHTADYRPDLVNAAQADRAVRRAREFVESVQGRQGRTG